MIAEARIHEHVAFGCIETGVEATINPHTREVEDGPYCTLTPDALCDVVGQSLFSTPYASLSRDQAKRVGIIVSGIEGLSEFHKFSDTAFDNAIEDYKTRGGE